MTIELRIQYTTTPDGVSIAWGEAGEGPALLYCGATPFTHVQEALSAYQDYLRAMTSSFRLITFDARGVGLSDREVSEVSKEHAHPSMLKQ